MWQGNASLLTDTGAYKPRATSLCCSQPSEKAEGKCHQYCVQVDTASLRLLMKDHVLHVLPTEAAGYTPVMLSHLGPRALG